MATLGELPVGSIVKLNVDGTARNFIVVHQGLPSSIYDSSCNGAWLLMENLFVTSKMNSTYVSTYSGSMVNSYLKNTFIPMLDEDIQNVVYNAKIPYSVKTFDEPPYALKTKSDGLSVNAFILSFIEIGGDMSKDALAEGACLSYFSGKGDAERIAYPLDSSTPANWWTRSPVTFSTDAGVWIVKGTSSSSAGTLQYTSSTSTNSYIRPALILPFDVFVKADGTITTSKFKFNGYTNVDGVNKELLGGYVNVDGVWKEISEAHTCVNGSIWKPMD